MLGESNEEESREPLGPGQVLLRSAGLFLVAVLLWFAVRIVILNAFDWQQPSDKIVFTPGRPSLLFYAEWLVLWVCLVLTFGLGWLKTKRRRASHPFLVATAAVVMPAILGYFAFYVAEDLALVWGLSLLSMAPMTMLVALIQLPVPSRRARDFSVIGSVAAVMVFVILTWPHSDFPHSGTLEERHAWAAETLGEPYVRTHRFFDSSRVVDDFFGDPAIGQDDRGWGRVTRKEDGSRFRITVDVSGEKESGRCWVRGVLEDGQLDFDFRPRCRAADGAWDLILERDGSLHEVFIKQNTHELRVKVRRRFIDLFDRKEYAKLLKELDAFEQLNPTADPGQIALVRARCHRRLGHATVAARQYAMAADAYRYRRPELAEIAAVNAVALAPDDPAVSEVAQMLLGEEMSEEPQPDAAETK